MQASLYPRRSKTRRNVTWWKQNMQVGFCCVIFTCRNTMPIFKETNSKCALCTMYNCQLHISDESRARINLMQMINISCNREKQKKEGVDISGNNVSDRDSLIEIYSCQLRLQYYNTYVTQLYFMLKFRKHKRSGYVGKQFKE